MRIAYVYDAVYPFIKGGGERRIYEVARRLSDRGHQIFILGMKCWDGAASLEENGLRYRAISPYINSYHSTGRRSIVQALGFGGFAWRILVEQKYDIIDCGQWPYFHMFPVKAYSFIRRTPFLVTWYEVWKSHWLDYLGWPGIFGMWAERIFCQFPDRLVAVCEMTRTDLVGLGMSQERIEVIPNGIDCARIQAVPPGPVRTDLAYCGRLKNHKNIHLLIEAVAILKRSLPTVSAVVIGDGPESAVLRNLAAQLGVSENIIFTGALDDFDEVISWLKASKVFVHPSTKEGGGSITLFEANACGLPVIAVKCANGIDPLLIEQGKNGYFVEPRPERIADTASFLLNNPVQLAENSTFSKKDAAKYDWDIIASQYEQVYEREISIQRMASYKTRDSRYKSNVFRRPNFLFIGPDKAGSTWLYEALKQHRQVYLSPVKELFFFDRFYDEGWDWYSRYFRGAGKHHRVVGEICHDYLFSPIACERIARDLPEARLMVCLREPSQRAFSEYLYLIKLGLLGCDFETALQQECQLIDNGRYATHLSRYLEHFHRDQIFVAVFDDLTVDPQRYFDKLCDFLELERFHLSNELRETVLPAAKPRLRHVTKFARGIGWHMRRLGLPGAVGRIKDSALLSRLLYSSYKAGEKPAMSPEAQRYLRGVFSPEIERLDAMLGTELRARWGYQDKRFVTKRME